MTPPRKVNVFEMLIEKTLMKEKDIDEHLVTLFGLVLSIKPNMIYELGTRTARSTVPFLLGAQYTKSKVVSVDIEDPQPDFFSHDGSPTAFPPKAWESSWTFVKKDAIEFLQEDFPVYRSMRSTIQQRQGDIIYIDDWHSYPHVKKELELVKDVTPNDMIILHDLMYGNSEPHYKSVEDPKDAQWANGGPYKAVFELDLDVWEYATIPRCNGLTLLRKKSEKVITND
tara:strand:- start:1005 stop:1685 length:681 start_codon:yes stop_codon:yes gene_type:complete